MGFLIDSFTIMLQGVWQVYKMCLLVGFDLVFTFEVEKSAQHCCGSLAYSCPGCGGPCCIFIALSAFLVVDLGYISSYGLVGKMLVHSYIVFIVGMAFRHLVVTRKLRWLYKYRMDPACDSFLALFYLFRPFFRSSSCKTFRTAFGSMLECLTQLLT